MNTLRSITGVHKWNNSSGKIRVENALSPSERLVEKNRLIDQKTPIEIEEVEEEEDESSSSSQTDISLQHFDVQLQVNHGRLQPATRYGVFTSILPTPHPTLKENQASQTVEPEVDMEYDNDNRRNRNSNGYSQTNNNNNSNGGGYRGNGQANGRGSGGGSGDGNGWNPNRNNNNNDPRR